jgi:hypothetical protein
MELLQRLSVLEALAAHSASSASDAATTSNAGESSTLTKLVPRASWAAVCQKAQVEEELRQKEKHMLRLRQVFAAKTADFHEALSAILGIKVAFYNNGQVRVTRRAGREGAPGAATADAELGRD